MSERCFFFNDTATTEIYTLSLHDALPISGTAAPRGCADLRAHAASRSAAGAARRRPPPRAAAPRVRSEEHTSELQSRLHLACRLPLGNKSQRRAWPCASTPCSGLNQQPRA